MLAVEVRNLTHEINNKKILNNIEFNLTKDSILVFLVLQEVEKQHY